MDDEKHLIADIPQKAIIAVGEKFFLFAIRHLYYNNIIIYNHDSKIITNWIICGGYCS